MLPHVLRFNCVTAAKAYEALAVHAFPDLRRFSGQERAAAFCSALADLSRACGLPQTLRDMNIPQDWLPRLAKDAMNQTRLLGNNPRPVTEQDALAIYQAAY
jgi:alcohol dehydrogenase class IV